MKKNLDNGGDTIITAASVAKSAADKVRIAQCHAELRRLFALDAWQVGVGIVPATTAQRAVKAMAIKLPTVGQVQAVAARRATMVALQQAFQPPHHLARTPFHIRKLPGVMYRVASFDGLGNPRTRVAIRRAA